MKPKPDTFSCTFTLKWPSLTLVQWAYPPIEVTLEFPRRIELLAKTHALLPMAVIFDNTPELTPELLPITVLLFLVVFYTKKDSIVTLKIPVVLESKKKGPLRFNGPF